MNAMFTPREGMALFRLLSANATDTLLKIDPSGTVVHAIPGVLPGTLVAPAEWVGKPFSGLGGPASRAELAEAHRTALVGTETRLEFAARTADGGEYWFETRVMPLTGRRGEIYSVLAVLRSIEDRKRYERELFAAALTDRLTGLTNRTAFVSMLQHLIDNAGVRPGQVGCVALFDIDHFKAVNLRYGQSVGDKVLVAFAHYVRAAMRETDIISRIGGESVGVILPGATAGQAEAVCSRVVASIAEIGGGSGLGTGIPITASAGAARIAASVDETLRQAEVALALAKAKGRNRLEMAA